MEKTEDKRMAGLGALLGTFFKIGAFTFGGGWAMLSLIEKEIVDNHRWMDREEYLDALSMVQALPGVLAVNMAVAVGFKTRRMRGALAAAAGAILPSFLIILAIAIFLSPTVIKENHTLAAIFSGIRPAVVALIVAPVITSARSAKLTRRTAAIPVVVAVMIWSKLPFVSNPILYIVLAILGGWLYESRSRKNSTPKPERL